MSEPYGLFYCRRWNDPLPPLDLPQQLTTQPADSLDAISAQCGFTRLELERRVAEGHQPWLARIGDDLAGWGWMATRAAHIGGLELSLALPSGDRYLWDFVTLPEWRGRRIYPALIQAMMRADLAAERFWIGHDMANQASRRGILRAGMTDIGAVHASPDSALVYVPHGPLELAAAGAALLGLPLADPASYPSASDQRPD